MKYYYLISSLPKLAIDDGSLSCDQLDDIIELITQNLTDDDLDVMKCLLHKNDNQNLLFVLFHEYHDFEIRFFNQPSSVPVEILENYRREFSSLPDYMMNYLNDLSSSFSAMTMREMEQNLNQYFYDHLLNKNSLFLNTYFSWIFQLEQTISRLNLKSFPFLVTKDESKELFFPKIQTLHDLTEQKEIANQIQPLIASKDVEGIERKINQYHWQFAASWQDAFSADQVFAYMVKLIRLYRWRRFSSKGETARTDFEKLIAEILEKRSSPKMPVI
ncbi:MAG: DUF2764 family protein [Cyclobacteriaceae bacterium]